MLFFRVLEKQKLKHKKRCKKNSLLFPPSLFFIFYLNTSTASLPTQTSEHSTKLPTITSPKHHPLGCRDTTTSRKIAASPPWINQASLQPMGGKINLKCNRTYSTTSITSHWCSSFYLGHYSRFHYYFLRLFWCNYSLFHYYCCRFVGFSTASFTNSAVASVGVTTPFFFTTILYSVSVSLLPPLLLLSFFLLHLLLPLSSLLLSFGFYLLLL